MKATVADKVVATAEITDITMIEGNRYFPPSSVNWSVLEPSETAYTCPWKGKAEYHSLVDGPKDVAWAYVAPNADALTRVGKDFSGFVAFDGAVVISD